MKDNLEDFIKNNRAAFDNKEPSERVWKNIDASLKPTKAGLWNSIGLWRAAAVVFMLLSGYLLIPKMLPAEKAVEDSMAANDFKDIEAFYVQEISVKKDLINQFQQADALNGFTQDFRQLEAMYMVLKEEMKTSPSEKVKDAMVLNLLVRINLLNQQLSKLDQKQVKRDKREEEV